MGHFRKLCNYRELLIRALKVNSPYINTPPLHMVYKNPIECTSRGWLFAYNTFHCLVSFRCMFGGRVEV